MFTIAINILLISNERQRQSLCFFFMVGDFTTYDRTISIQNKNFVSLIKHVGDYCDIGLKTTFKSLNSIRVLKLEKERLEVITNKPIVGCRQSFSKVNLPDSYRNLVDLEIYNDYTMGYIDALGFRAGTCTPFLFYDLDYEIQTPLIVYSFQFLDHAVIKVNSLLDKQQALTKIMNEIKAVNGTFIPVYHNYTFSDEAKWKHFKSLFKHVLNDK